MSVFTDIYDNDPAAIALREEVFSVIGDKPPGPYMVINPKREEIEPALFGRDMLSSGRL